jgi:hypothetical protein
MFLIKGGYATDCQGYMSVKLSYTTVTHNYTTVNPSHATVKISYPTVTYNLPTLYHESTNNLQPVVYQCLRKYAVCEGGNFGYLPRYSLPEAFFRPP